MAFIFKRREVQLLIIAAAFLTVLLPYFFNIPGGDAVANKLTMIVSVINAMTILLALVSQTRRSVELVRQRAHGWVYQGYLVIAIYLMALMGFVFGQSSSQFTWFQYAILLPTGSVIYSILTFYMASAAARAFRARSINAGLLLLAGILVLVGQAPASDVYFPLFGRVRLYLTDTFAMAAGRMFLMGVTIGAIVLAVRIIAGRESQAIGFEAG